MEPICQLKDIYKALYAFEKSFAQKTGITINEAMLLCCLKDGKSKTASDIQEFIGLSSSRVSRIINTIEEKELIKREIGIEDKRQMIFSLTDLGIARIVEMQNQNLDFDKLTSEIKQSLK